MLRQMQNRVLNSEFPPEDDSWFRFRGFAAAVQMIKYHVLGFDGPTADQIVDSLVPIDQEDD